MPDCDAEGVPAFHSGTIGCDSHLGQCNGMESYTSVAPKQTYTVIIISTELHTTSSLCKLFVRF